MSLFIYCILIIAHYHIMKCNSMNYLICINEIILNQVCLHRIFNNEYIRNHYLLNYAILISEQS